MTPANRDDVLADVRREIDEIDDALLDLMLRRRATSSRVRDLKGGSTGMTATPYRPAREAQIMRRLIERSGGGMDPGNLVRLWRVILSSSINAQATVTIHVDSTVAADVTGRILIAEHFCGMPVARHAETHDAIAAAGARALDLVAFDTAGPWAENLVAAPHGLKVIAGLPMAGPCAGMPRLVVAGKAEPQESGDDQTILLTDRSIAPGLLPKRCWEVQSGSLVVTAIPGFLTRTSPLLQSITGSDPTLQLHIGGVIPATMKATP